MLVRRHEGPTPPTTHSCRLLCNHPDATKHRAWSRDLDQRWLSARPWWDLWHHDLGHWDRQWPPGVYPLPVLQSPRHFYKRKTGTITCNDFLKRIKTSEIIQYTFTNSPLQLLVIWLGLTTPKSKKCKLWWCMYHSGPSWYGETVGPTAPGAQVGVRRSHGPCHISCYVVISMPNQNSRMSIADTETWLVQGLLWIHTKL